MAEYNIADLEQTRSAVRRPADFEAFWTRVGDELASAPLEWDRIPDESASTPNMSVSWLKFTSINDQTVYAWLAVPAAVQEKGNAGFLWLPGYSLGNPPPAAESLYEKTISVGLNVHGNTPDMPYVHPSVQGMEYITRGIESPETYVYRSIVAHCLRAIEVMAQQPEIDPAKLMVGGMSQGGGLALIVAALARSRVRLCLADMPWLCDLDRALALLDRARYARLPRVRIPDVRALIEDYADAYPELREQIFTTYRYFDPLSHAAEIRCPTQVSAGGRDPSCKPPTIYSMYNELTCTKEMLYLPQTGHEIVPAMHTAHAKWVKQVAGV